MLGMRATAFQKTLVNRVSRSLIRFNGIPCIRQMVSTHNLATASAKLLVKCSRGRWTIFEYMSAATLRVMIVLLPRWVRDSPLTKSLCRPAKGAS